MARLATEADFFGARGGRTGTALYSAYRRYPHFSERVERFLSRYPVGNTILVAGCGFGYLVDEARLRGFANVWGCDASAWAIDQGRAALPQVAARLVVADVLVLAQLAAARASAGLRPNQRFDAAVTEDLLPALTDAEVAVALANLRQTAQQVAHVVTAATPAADVYVADLRAADAPAAGDAAKTHRLQGLNWKSASGWRAVIGGADPIFDAETGVLV